MTISFLGLRVSFSWWAEEKQLSVKIKPMRKRRRIAGSWKAGYDLSVDFLGLRVGCWWWKEQKELEINIMPASLMCLRPDGSKRIWRGINVFLGGTNTTCGRGSWTLWDWKWVRFWG